MTKFSITLYTFLCSDHMTLLKTFEGQKDANHNEKSPVTLQITEDMRMQFVDLFSIGFVNKLMSATVSSLKFSNFKAFDLLKSYGTKNFSVHCTD